MVRHVFVCVSQIDIFMHKIILVPLRITVDALHLKTIVIFVLLAFYEYFRTFVAFMLCFWIAYNENKGCCSSSSSHTLWRYDFLLFTWACIELPMCWTSEFEEFHVKITFDGIKFLFDQHAVIGHVEKWHWSREWALFVFSGHWMHLIYCNDVPRNFILKFVGYSKPHSLAVVFNSKNHQLTCISW